MVANPVKCVISKYPTSLLCPPSQQLGSLSSRYVLLYRTSSQPPRLSLTRSPMISLHTNYVMSGLYHQPSPANAQTDCIRRPNYLSSTHFCTEATTAESPETTIHEFKAETKKLLHIVAHSLYTDREVFIRELISNASDALEKLRFLQSTSQAANLLDPDVELKICITVDTSGKTITIEDTGIGMTKDELISNLGTIAKSGSLEFLNDNKLSTKDKADAIIGQFGVGFYSSFVVSESVEVFTRSYDLEKCPCGYHWSSDGLGSFTVRECNDLRRGTKIICHLKDECLEYANVNTAKQCAQKFSSFVRFPLFIDEGNDKMTEINKQEALWLRSSATNEEHLQFFRYLNNASWGEPMYTLMYQADAPLSIKSVFYVPQDAPSRLFQSKSEVGIALHSKRILVKKSAEDIIPKWLFFVKGVVDCEDLPLNISRENMQDSRLIEKLSSTIVKRLLKFFDDQSSLDPVKFRKFYSQYSYNLKEGVLDDVQKSGKYKENILKLLRYECSEKEAKEWITLDDYINTMKPNQKNIYYFCASDRKTALASPYMEDFKRRKRNVLLMYDDIDEFVSMNIQNYKDKKFVSVDSPEGDFEPLLEESANENSQQQGSTGLIGPQQSELQTFMKNVLGQKVTAVNFSDRLVKSPAVVSGFLSATLRKMMKATLKGAADSQMDMANLPATLELNPTHPIVTSLYQLKTSNPTVAKMLAEQLYDNACVAAGILEDPRTMLDRLNNILEITAQYAFHHNKNEPLENLSPNICEGELDTKDCNEKISNINLNQEDKTDDLFFDEHEKTYENEILHDLDDNMDSVLDEEVGKLETEYSNMTPDGKVSKIDASSGSV